MFKENNTIGRGRPSGAKNKSSISIKENFQQLIENNMEQLDADIKALNPRDRIKAITELARFVVPTLKQVDAEVLNTTNDITWLDKYTENELELILKNN